MSHIVSIATYVAVMLIFLVGAWRSPPSCVAALYCLFPLKQLGQSSIGFLQTHSSITNILIGLIVVVATLRNWPTLILRLRHHPSSYFIAITLYVYALCSIGWSPAPGEATQRWASAWPYLITAIFLAPLSISAAHEFRTALRWLTWMGGLVCLALLIGGDWGSRGLLVSGASGEFESNPLAVAATAGAVAIASFIQRPSPPLLMQIPASIAAGISSIFLIIRSGSRGELLAALVAIALVCPLRFRITRLRDVIAGAVLATLIAIGLIVGMSQYKGGGDDRWSQSMVSSDTAGRLDMAGKLLDRWSKSADTILFGLGNSASFDSRIVGFYPHVLPAEILGEEGLLGLFLFLGVVFLATQAGLSGWKSAMHQSLVRDTIATAIALAAFSFIVSSKEGNLLSNYILFTALINVCRISGDKPELSIPALQKPAVRFDNLLN